MKDSIEFLTIEELKALLNVITNDRDRLMVLLAYRKGLRVSETTGITLDQINLIFNTIYVKRLKGSLSREYPLYDDEVKLIKRVLKQRRGITNYLFESQKNCKLDRSSVAKKFKRYSKQANIQPDKTHFHVLKHSIASHMVKDQANIKAIQKQLGHKSLKNTLVYTHIDLSTADKAVDQARLNGNVL